MRHGPFTARRRRLLDQLAKNGNGIAIIPTAPERVRNRDSHHPYRFDSYFWYLTGFPEPEAVVVLIGGDATRAPQSILFCREKNEEREIWDGYRYGPEGAREGFADGQAAPAQNRLGGVQDQEPPEPMSKIQRPMFALLP